MLILQTRRAGQIPFAQSVLGVPPINLANAQLDKLIAFGRIRVPESAGN